MTIEKDGKMALKKRHAYYYQVQGILQVTSRKKCHFVVYIDKEFHYEIIMRDDDLWRYNMLPKLEW